MPIESVSSAASASKSYLVETNQKRTARSESGMTPAMPAQSKRDEVQLSARARQLASQSSVDSSNRPDQAQSPDNSMRAPRGSAADAIAAYQKAART